MADARSLSALLSRTLVAFTRDYEAAGNAPTLPLWAGVLRVLVDDGVLRRDLPRETRLSKRAVRTIVKGCVASGLADEVDEVVRPTSVGRAGRDAGRRRVAATERAWRETFGSDIVGELTATLRSLVAQLELELPHYPIGYGTADASVGRGNQDWRPVPRGEGETVKGVTLPGLLSQALMAFALDYESHRAWSMSGASVIAQIQDRMPRRDQPHGAGIAGDGRSGLERHGIVTVDVVGGVQRIRLTKAGRYVQRMYRELPPRIEGEWSERYGTSTVGSLRSVLEAVDAGLEGRLPDFPLINWIGRLEEASER